MSIPRVVIAEADTGVRTWLETCLGRDFDTRVLASGAAFLSDVDKLLADKAHALNDERANEPTTVLVVGQSQSDTTGTQLLEQLAKRADALSEYRIPVFVSATGTSPPWTQDDFPDDLAIHYVLDRRLSGEHIRSLVLRASSGTGRGNGHSIENAAEASQVAIFLGISRSLSTMSSLDEAAGVIERSVVELLDADRVYCLFHDASSGILWSETDPAHGDEELGAFVGLSGFAARTASAVATSCAQDDPRYERSVDDPSGSGRESIIACPVIDAHGAVHVVLVAIRANAEFTDDNVATLEQLANYLSPGIHQLALLAEVESVIEAERVESPRIFRDEAFDAYNSRGRSGDVVRVLPPWVRWSYWLLLVLMALGTTYMIVGRIDEYSSGPAMVRMSGRDDVTAHVSGKVVSVAVVPGQRVARGEVLARLYNVEETAEYQRLTREWHARLRARMLEPGDTAARQAAAALRTDVRRAEARLEDRTIRAPNDGAVVDVRIHPGQHLNPGDLVASIVGDDTELSVIALLPGADRPKLKPGMELRLELVGYRYAYQNLVIDKVSDEIIGPAEARRYLGKRLGDGVFVSGPVVIVEAKLPTDEFTAHGTLYSYHDGLQGVAEIRTRSRRIVVALIPPLEEL